jgi:transposase
MECRFDSETDTMARKKRDRRRYATDLTDGQWALIAPLIPEAEPGGRPRKASTRTLVNAILYFLRAGMAWRLLPHDLPPWQTVYYYLCGFRRLRPGNPIECGHAFRSKAATCSDEGDRAPLPA